MAGVNGRTFLLTGAAATGGLILPAQAATGTITIKIFSAGFILGVTGGDGSLLFQGQQYLLSVGGLSAGVLAGVAAAEFVGTASHLNAVTDIEGTYAAVAAGLSVAGGAGVAQLSNAKGVVLRLRSRKVGFMVSVDLSGLSISLK